MNDDWKTTACPYDCPCACSMLARVNGGIIELRVNPANRQCSFICAKGRRFIKRINDPRRLLHPLLRRGAEWVKISWDEALGLWAEKISAAVKDCGPLSVMSFASAGSMTFSKRLIPAFYAALGGFTKTKGTLCSSIGSAGLKESTCGFGVPYVPLEDISTARGLLFWGRNSRHTQPQMAPASRRCGAAAERRPASRCASRRRRRRATASGGYRRVATGRLPPGYAAGWRMIKGTAAAGARVS